jgi:hypothetical protein
MSVRFSQDRCSECGRTFNGVYEPIFHSIVNDADSSDEETSQISVITGLFGESWGEYDQSSASEGDDEGEIRERGVSRGFDRGNLLLTNVQNLSGEESAHKKCSRIVKSLFSILLFSGSILWLNGFQRV